MNYIEVSFYARVSKNSEEIKLEQKPFVELYLNTPKQLTLICVN